MTVSVKQLGWEGVWGVSGKRGNGKLGILECGLNQHWILQEAELDTRVCIQEVYFGKFHPEELDWETGKSHTRKVCYQAQQYHGAPWYNNTIGAPSSRGRSEKVRRAHLRVVHQKDKEKLSISFLSPLVRLHGQGSMFMTLHFQDCTCFRIAKWFPEGILRHGKGEAPEQKARDGCGHWCRVCVWGWPPHQAGCCKKVDKEDVIQGTRRGRHQLFGARV